jgi:hypothetical protein
MMRTACVYAKSELWFEISESADSVSKCTERIGIDVAYNQSDNTLIQIRNLPCRWPTMSPVLASAAEDRR